MHTFIQVSAQLEHFENFVFWTPLWPLNDSSLHSILFNRAKNVTRILLVKFELNWSILKTLTFEPLYDPLMTIL